MQPLYNINCARKGASIDNIEKPGVAGERGYMQV